MDHGAMCSMNVCNPFPSTPLTLLTASQMLFTWDTTVTQNPSRPRVRQKSDSFCFQNLCVVFRSWRVTGSVSLVATLLVIVLLTAGYEAVRELARRYESGGQRDFEASPSMFFPSHFINPPTPPAPVPLSSNTTSLSILLYFCNSEIAILSLFLPLRPFRCLFSSFFVSKNSATKAKTLSLNPAKKTKATTTPPLLLPQNTAHYYGQQQDSMPRDDKKPNPSEPLCTPSRSSTASSSCCFS